MDRKEDDSIGNLEIFDEIDHVRELEKALLESEERLRSFMDFATEAFVLLDSKLHVIEANRIALNTVGLERKDAINKYYGDIVPSFEESKTRVNYLRVLKSGNSIIMTDYVPHPEYGSRKYDVKIFKVGDGIGVIATDITEFKLVEQALKSNEENLRQVIQNMPVMLDAFDENDHIIVWNRECERVTGYTAEEMIGDLNALEKLYPDQKYLSRLLKEWSEKGDEFYNWETDITHKDGTTKKVTWSNISKHFPVPGWKSWAVGFDITDRIKLEDELLEKRKLAALGQMAAGLAHELNTPLANINLTTDYLMSFINNNKINNFDINPVMNELKDIKEQINYCGQIIKNLLHFSRKIEISKSNFNLNSFFTEIVSSPSIESSITEKNIDIIMEIDKSATLNGDKVLLSQCFQNLIINSIDAMISSQTDPTIKISVLENDEGSEISFKDNGRGIKEEYLPRIFDPFFTTKEVGRGTGLGLSITRGIIEKHKGEITVKSIYGEGTEILVVLPRTSS